MNEENITEKQVISFLLNKQQFLKEELNKVELALEALNVDANSSTITNLKTVNSNKINSPILEKVSEFDPNSKLDNKIAFALSQNKDLTKDEILEVIIKHSPGIDKYKFEKTLSVRLSYLLKSRLITGVKSGRNYVYNLSTMDNAIEDN